MRDKQMSSPRGCAMLGRGVLRGARHARNTLDFRFAGFEIDIPRRELRRASEFVSIEPQVFDLLVHLVRNHDRIATKDELIEP
jgi:DNA-binding winged helix-turn-helix (wHTH) protein